MSRWSKEEGIVAVWVGLLAFVLVGVGAFGVDVARWYVDAERLQKTVDLAALGGVPFLPGDETSAIETARDIAVQNGWTIDGTDVTFDAAKVPDQPTRLRVTMSSDVPNAFGKIFNVPTTRVTRTGVADFSAPVPLGSPCNVFGNQEMAGDGETPISDPLCPPDPQYWVNIAGTESSKDFGDDYSAAWCVTHGGAPTIDNCRTTGPNSEKNLRYRNDEGDIFPGYVFIVEPQTSGTLELEAYDIGWVETGDLCRRNTAPDIDDDNPRYARVGNGSSAPPAGGFCSGDVQFNSRANPDNFVRTEVSVLRPSTNPYRPLDGTAIPGCDAFAYPGWDKETAEDDFGSDTLLTQTFHRWSGLCGTASPTSIPGVLAGERYAIKINTTQGGGHNRFALRARVAGAGSPSAVRIFAVNQFSIYTNTEGGNSLFNMVQLDSSTAGKTLKIDFYDIGDAQDDITVTVLQPVTPTQGNTDLAFGDCKARVGSEPNGWVVGPSPQDISGCSFSVSPGPAVNARLRSIFAEIPSNYTCEPTPGSNNCWVTVKYNSLAGQQDTTTWSAEVIGDPVRIVE